MDRFSYLVLFTALALPIALPTTAAPICDSDRVVALTVGSCNVSLPGIVPNVYSWGVRLGVNNTPICASPSTVTRACLIEHQNACLPGTVSRGDMTEAECRSRRGNYVSNTTVQLVDPGNLEAENSNWDTIMGDLPTFQWGIQAPFQLQGTTAIQPFSGLITQGINHKNSHFSIDSRSSVISALRQAGLIAANSFGLDVGSTSWLRPRPGRLILGGYEREKVAGEFYTFNMNAYEEILGNRACPIQVLVTQLDLRVDGKPQTLALPDSRIPFCVEPYDSLFRFPKIQLNSTRDYIANRTGWTQAAKDDNGRYGGLLNLEPGMIYDVTKGFNTSMSLEITLLGGLKVVVPEEELLQPLRGLDADGAPAVNPSFREVHIYREPNIEFAPVLGQAFLSQLYLHTNYDKRIFQLGVLAKDVGPSEPISSNECMADNKLPGPTIGLIVVGVVLGILILVLGYLWWRPRHQPTRREKGKAVPEPPARSSTSSSDEEQPQVWVKGANTPQVTGVPTRADAQVLKLR